MNEAEEETVEPIVVHTEVASDAPVTAVVVSDWSCLC